MAATNTRRVDAPGRRRRAEDPPSRTPRAPKRLRSGDVVDLTFGGAPETVPSVEAPPGISPIAIRDAALQQMKPAEATPLNLSGSEDLGPLVLRSSTNGQVYNVPSQFNNQLRPFQREGVEFLFSLWAQNRGGLLGDEMGLGKTVQTIAFLVAILAGPVSPTRSAVTQQQQQQDAFFRPTTQLTYTIPAALVVVPASVMDQWLSEVRRFSSLRCAVYQDKKFRSSRLGCCRTGRTQVLIVSYDVFRRDFDDLMFIKKSGDKIPSGEWTAVIFDEVHRIKSPQSKLSQLCRTSGLPKRNRRFFGLTGTIIQNSFEELWAIIDFVSPGHLGTRVQFRSRFVSSIKDGQRRDASLFQIGQARKAAQRLASEVKKVVIRREKGDVLSSEDLPEKEDRVVFCQLAPMQRRMLLRIQRSDEFQRLRQGATDTEPIPQTNGVVFSDLGAPRSENVARAAPSSVRSVAAPASVPVSAHELLPMITRLLKISNNPALVADFATSDDERGDGGSARENTRERSFAKLALGSDEAEFLRLHDSVSDEDICGKVSVLKSLLQTLKSEASEGGFPFKILVFSYSTKNLDRLGQVLRREGYSLSQLDGRTPVAKRSAIVEEFKTSPQRELFLISTKAGGLGLVCLFVFVFARLGIVPF
jgi:DNA excision repair protein ERCC-6-like 2